MPLIGISGKAFSGKDTFADVFTEVAINKYNIPQERIKRMSFAGLLKQYAMDHFDLSYEQISVPELKETVDERWGMTPRKIMQGLGGAYRSIYTNYWTDAVLNKYTDPEDLFFITDCRYLNEADLIRERGGNVIRIERPLENRPSVTDPNHPSEIELDGYLNFFMTVNNDREIEDLVEYADDLCAFLGYIPGGIMNDIEGEVKTSAQR